VASLPKGILFRSPLEAQIEVIYFKVIKFTKDKYRSNENLKHILGQCKHSLHNKKKKKKKKIRREIHACCTA
jgi:hypothetical protein